MMHDGSRLIEVGWVIVGRVEGTDREAIFKARDHLLTDLRQRFTAFTWRMPIVQREEWSQDYRAEPAALLDYGLAERDVNHWDFAFIVTDVDLVSYYKPYALGALSRSVSIGIISTARLDPQAAHQEVTNDERLSVMPRRIAALGLHLFGHLNGLVHDESTDGYMYNIETVDDLDRLSHYAAAQTQQLEANLHEVADVRLEEEASGARVQPLYFYVRAMWRGQADIARAISQAKPWEFPFRLSRLTTAALSALLILLMTAEAWDLGMSQTIGLVSALSCATLVMTSFYILRRQRLLMRRETRALSEQTVITNVSVSAVVLLGMLTTYGVLFFGALGLSAILFRHRLVVTWAASLEGSISMHHYLILAAFVASLGLLIGALGASFEQHHYFRHVTYIDEET